MKNFKFLLSVAVASAFVACSSMDVDEDEALVGNFPEDFSDATYMSMHPELVRIQIKDYVFDHNDKLASDAKAAGPEAQAAFDSMKTADMTAFEGDTAILHKIMTDPQLAGYDSSDWIRDWGGSESVKDSIFASETKRDTLSLTIDDSTDAAAVKVIKVRFVAEGDSVKTGSIEYDADGNITKLSGYKYEKVDKEWTLVDPALQDIEIVAGMSINSKGIEAKTDTLKMDTIQVTVSAEGSIGADHMKVLKTLNLYDTVNDFDALKAVVIDTFAVSYQYVMYGRDHGWPYRPCTESEKTNLPYDPNVYPAEKLYCADENGNTHEIN